MVIFMKKNNKGFTLVELVVTFTILAILTVVTSLSLSVIFKNRAREAASDIDSLLTSCRVSALCGEGKTPYVLIKKESGVYNAYLYTSSTGNAKTVEPLGSGFDVKYEKAGTKNNIAEGSQLKLSYHRDTGAINEGSDISRIWVTSEYSIDLKPLTGYHEIVKH